MLNRFDYKLKQIFRYMLDNNYDSLEEIHELVTDNYSYDDWDSSEFLENPAKFHLMMFNYIKKHKEEYTSRRGTEKYEELVGKYEKYEQECYKDTDPFLEDIVCANRLIKEWNEHGKIIVAFDFDGTVFDYLGNGSTHEKVIGFLKEIQNDAHIYCFSARNEEEYTFLESQIKEKDLPCDGINIDYDFIRFKGRKPYYNILLDDRAGLFSSFSILKYAWKYKD